MQNSSSHTHCQAAQANHIAKAWQRVCLLLQLNIKNFLPLDDKITDLALNSEFRDFENAIQYYTAIENDQDLIITRNQQDFKESKIPIMTAGEFIKTIKK